MPVLFVVLVFGWVGVVQNAERNTCRSRAVCKPRKAGPICHLVLCSICIYPTFLWLRTTSGWTEGEDRNAAVSPYNGGQVSVALTASKHPTAL